MENYECHVTVPFSTEKIPRFQQLATEHGWSSSWIDGDPLLGMKRHFYFTRHETTRFKAYMAIQDLVIHLEPGECLRRKIEQVIFDVRS